jgi:acetyl-CoA carboxylase biotin carboxyl carrier protein
MALSFREVAEILKIVDASQCEEVVLELEGTRLVVRRGGATAGSAAPAQAGSASAASSVPAGSSTGGGAPAAGVPAGELQEGQAAVRSPMVGTFYRSPEPDKPPFVETGTAVRKGDPLCLIEVMKLFTTIESPVDGTIAAILVENGAQVEFDQVLFAIAPA